MNCLFCAAHSAPQAKFCSECGSPLSLQICPTCAAVNEKTESTCLQCGHVFALQHEPDVAAAEPHIASLRPTTPASNALVDTRVHDWEVLLQEIEQEVHRQLAAEQHAPPVQNRPSLATQMARMASVATNRHPTRYPGRASDTRLARSRLSGLVVVLTLVLVGTAAPYLLSSSSATTTLSKHDHASPNQTAAAPQPISLTRVLPPSDEVDRGGSAAAAVSATATSVSLTNSQLVPASNDLPAMVETKHDGEFIPTSLAPSAEVVLDEHKQDEGAQAAARKATPPPRRTSARGGEGAMRVPGSPVEHRVIAQAPARYPAQPAVANSAPCSAGIQALALCGDPYKK
jgi:hypothetical protein